MASPLNYALLAHSSSSSQQLKSEVLQPDFSITLKDSLSLKDKELINLSHRNTEIKLSDKRGLEADELTITVTDYDNQLVIPNFDAELTLSIGYKNALVNKGIYIVDEISYSGYPSVLTITARSADFTSGLREQKERSFKATNLGQLFEMLASECQLTPAIHADLYNIQLSHTTQTNESNANLITRLAELYDCIATLKSGYLIASKKSQATTVTGKALPTLILQQNEIKTFSFSRVKQEFYCVKALWNAKKYAKRTTETIGDPSKTTKTLRQTYTNAANARAAAQSELNKIRRNIKMLNISLDIGNAAVIPEMPVIIHGMKPDISNEVWVIKECEHSLDSNGFNTTINLELKD